MIGYKSKDEDVAVGIDYMPERKKPCLIVKMENKYMKCASFNNEYSARFFMDSLAVVFGAEKVDWSSDYVPLGLNTEWNDFEKGGVKNEML